MRPIDWMKVVHKLVPIPEKAIIQKDIIDDDGQYIWYENIYNSVCFMLPNCFLIAP